MKLRFAAVCLLLVLGGCGGGGGGSDGDTGEGGSNWDEMIWDQGEWA